MLKMGMQERIGMESILKHYFVKGSNDNLPYIMEDAKATL